MPDTLELASIQTALEETLFAGKLQIFPTISSTNTYAMQQGANGASHGSVYIAEEQTSGRGRSDHAWHSEPCAGLYVSVLLRPQIVPADALWLSLAAGLAAQAAVENVTALVADIRWPNDLMFGSRKFGGILTEMNAEVTRVRYAVIGIGVNVNHTRFPSELNRLATSLRLESDRTISRQDLLIALLLGLQQELHGLLDPAALQVTSRSILQRLAKRSSWIEGKRVSVEESGGYTGVTAGLDARGFLRVRTADKVRTVLSGGVREAESGD